MSTGAGASRYGENELEHELNQTIPPTHMMFAHVEKTRRRRVYAGVNVRTQFGHRRLILMQLRSR